MRLTEFRDGIWRLSLKAIKQGYDRYSVYSRLAAYEDSGLSPDEVQELAKAKADGRLAEVVRCGECRKIMTEECILCSFDIDGYCTGGPDNDQFCSFGVAAEKAIAEVGE